VKSSYRQFVGPAVLVGAAVAYLALWVVARPADQPVARYVGEILGAEAVLLFSSALVLATLFPFIERAFDGLDRVAIWHRYAAIVGVVLMLVHPLFASAGPRPDINAVSASGAAMGTIAMWGFLLLSIWALAPSLARARWAGSLRRLAKISYERWLTGHRLMGLFVIAAVLHAIFIDQVLRESTTLLAGYLVVGGVGIAAYLYRELFARFVVPVHDYTVAKATHLNASTLDVSLKPTGKALPFQAGQFIGLAFGGSLGWQRHPFTIASSPSDEALDVTIRAAGDYTRELFDELKPGTPAKVVGPFGSFDFRRGGASQIWVAGGVGVTPFMSWIRSMDDSFDRDVTFWYSVKDEADAIFLDEIKAAAQRHPTFRPRLVATSEQGRLTAGKAAEGLSPGKATWVYMCGPDAMTSSLAKGFEGLGVPTDQIRYERFSIR
jgi:predicted ferric reductase